MKEVLDKLTDEGVKRLKFYYKKERLVGNICTVCLLIGENDELLSRGVSICSLQDSHRKATGKNISLGRAIKALKNQKTTDEINSNRDSLINWIYTKNINEKDPYYEEILEEIKHNNFDTTNLKINKDEVLRVEIPMDFPLYITNLLFKFKSTYKPVPTDEEIKIIGKRKLAR